MQERRRIVGIKGPLQPEQLSQQLGSRVCYLRFECLTDLSLAFDVPGTFIEVTNSGFQIVYVDSQLYRRLVVLALGTTNDPSQFVITDRISIQPSRFGAFVRSEPNVIKEITRQIQWASNHKEQSKEEFNDLIQLLCQQEGQ